MQKISPGSPWHCQHFRLTLKAVTQIRLLQPTCMKKQEKEKQQDAGAGIAIDHTAKNRIKKAGRMKNRKHQPIKQKPGMKPLLNLFQKPVKPFWITPAKSKATLIGPNSKRNCLASTWNNRDSIWNRFHSIEIYYHSKWNRVAATWNHRYSIWNCSHSLENIYYSVWNCPDSTWNYPDSIGNCPDSWLLRIAESGAGSDRYENYPVIAGLMPVRPETE